MMAPINPQFTLTLPSNGARQGNPLNDKNPTPYYLSCFSAWFHNHANGTAGMLVQVRHRALQCEHCGVRWETKPDKDWVSKRTRRIDEVMARLRPTEDPWVFQCPERSRHDGMVYRIEFDTGVHRWTCTCKDFRMYASRFWGGCKHVRAVKKTIAVELAKREDQHEIYAEEPDDLLPIGRPIRGEGWEATLLTKSQNGVAYLEVQGVIHRESQDAVWEEFRQKKFEVSPDCVWIDIAKSMAKGD